MTAPDIQLFQRQLSRLPSGSGVMLGVLVLIVFFATATPFFFNPENFMNIGRQSVVLAVAAFGMTFIILSGEIDLSMGAVGALAGIFCAMALQAGIPLFLSLLLALVTGLVFGFINGIITVRLGVPSFIVTLGIASIVSAIARTLTKNKPVSVFDETFLSLFADGNLLGIAINIWYVVLLFFLLSLVLHRTTFGISVYAVGGNMNATRLSGIAATRLKIMVFMLASALVSLAGVLQTARLGTARVDPITNLELDAIAAVVLGGTSFTGGRGTLLGTVLGVLLIGVLNNGLALMNIDSYYQLVIKGIIVIVAVLLDRWSITSR